MAFEDKEIKRKKGLKVNNVASSVPSAKVNNAAAFEEQAKNAFAKHETYKQRTMELSSRFKGMMEDRVLAANKNSISRDVEKEVIDKLIFLASDINADEDQPEGLGGVALCVLVMKMLLLQRDQINELSYKLEKLQKSEK